MKNVCLTAAVLAMILISVTRAPSQEQPLWPESVFPVEKLNGRVESVIEKAWDISSEEGEPGRSLEYILELRYGSGGELLSEIYYNEDGSEGNSIEYTWENGLLVLKTQYHPDIRNPDREHYLMSPDGRILEAEKIFSQGRYGWRFKNSYDSHGRLILTSKYDRFWNWMLVYSRLYDYDDAGRLSTTESYGMDSSLLWRDEYRYDADGRVGESLKYNPAGDIVVRIVDSYGPEGLHVRREFFDGLGEAYAVYSYGYRFDEQRNWTVKIIGHEANGVSGSWLVPESIVEREILYSD